MRFTPLVVVPALALALVLAGCATDPSPGVVTPNPGAAPDAPSTGGGLPADVFPFDSSAASFATGNGELLTVRMEATATGARMTVADDASTRGYYDWRREGADILLSDGPDRWIAMLRIGAQPGASWESSGRTIRFDGWELIRTPAGEYNAVRITSAAVASNLEESETWWFSPGVGLVRLTQNKGNLFRTEMWRTR